MDQATENLATDTETLVSFITKLTLIPVKHEPSEELVHIGKLCFAHSHKDLELLPMAS